MDAVRDQAGGQARLPLEPHGQRHRQRIQQLSGGAASDQRPATGRRPDPERTEHGSGQRHRSDDGLAAAPGALERQLGRGHADGAMPRHEQPRSVRCRRQSGGRHAGHGRRGRPHRAVGRAGGRAPERPGVPGHGQRHRRCVRHRHGGRRRGQSRADRRQHPHVRGQRPRHLPRQHRQLRHLQPRRDAAQRRERCAGQLPGAGLSRAGRPEPVGRGRPREGRGARAVHAGDRHRDGERAGPEERLRHIQRRRDHRPDRHRCAARRPGPSQRPEHRHTAGQPDRHRGTVGAVLGARG